MTRTTRRGFGQVLLGGAAVAAKPNRYVEIGDRAQLFLHDDYLIETRSGLRLVMTRPEKRPGGPLLVPDRPPELGVLGYVCILHDRDEKVYKMWYEARENNGVLGDPSRPERGRCLYATSVDGIQWERPALNAIELPGERDHNVVFTGPKGQRTKVYWVFKDYADPDEGKRYKMMFHVWDFRGRGVGIAHSPDGIHWSASRFARMTGGFDSQNLFFWDDRAGEYAGYLRTRHDGRRCIGRATSPDAFHWSNPVTVHCPDEQDPAEFDLYTPGVFKYSGAENVYVMYTAAFSWPGDSLFGQMCVSRDGIHWHRFREPFLPLGQKGEWDSGSIFPVPSEASVGGQTAVYFTGNHVGHGPGGKPGVGVAFLQEGAFAGWRADGEGVLTTPALHIVDPRDAFFLNANAEGGSIRAEILDAGGQVLAGYTRADSAEILKAGTSLRLRWKQETARKGAVRLRLYLNRATVYGFQSRRVRKEEINE